MSHLEGLRATIEEAYELPTSNLGEAHRAAVQEALEGLDTGVFRVAEKQGPDWITHDWLKKSILIYFRTQGVSLSRAGDFEFCDKIPVKKWSLDQQVRVVPMALARFGSFVSPGAILMPSFINIGAYVGRGTMVDTWATVRSCAQIGEGVHLSGGVGIGGVLEPPQAQPVVIEDHAFIGSRCILVEGVRIGEGAILAAGVTLTATTKILDVTGPEVKVMQGFVPPRSVVIPGTTTKEFPAGRFGVPCALIIGTRKPSTDQKTSLNQTLREFQISV